MPTIKSSTDLRNSYNAISTFCHESREPVFITKNGQGDLAVMSIELYEEMADAYTIPSKERLKAAEQELYDLLAEGHADLIAGRFRPAEEVFNDLERRIADGSIYSKRTDRRRK